MPRIHCTLRESSRHQITAHNNIQDACHEQLNDLCDANNARSNLLSEANFSNGNVTITNTKRFTCRRIWFVQALNENLKDKED